jgi:hypothetical protein
MAEDQMNNPTQLFIKRGIYAQFLSETFWPKLAYDVMEVE